MHMCPIHAVWEYCKTFSIGQQIFPGVKAKHAISKLRQVLQGLDVENASMYRTHDLRRGHADDLVENGTSVSNLLLMGEWAPPAFFKYINLALLEARTVTSAHVDNSSSEEEEISDED